MNLKKMTLILAAAAVTALPLMAGQACCGAKKDAKQADKTACVKSDADKCQTACQSTKDASKTKCTQAEAAAKTAAEKPAE